MPKHHPKDCLSLDLKGDLSLDKFEKAVAAFFDLIKEVTKEALTEKQRIRWTVTVRSGSAIVNAVPHFEESVADQAKQILRAVPAGIRALESGAQAMPKMFTREAVRAVKILGGLRGMKGNDVTDVRIRSASVKSRITTKSVAAVDAMIGGQRQSYGAIEGKMQTITERGGFRFVVYDSLHDHRVDCFIEEDLMEKAVSNFRKRVRVSGLVQYDRAGDPVSIKVTEIYVFRPNIELPSVHEMRGIFKEA
jgi:hypothetical protein